MDVNAPYPPFSGDAKPCKKCGGRLAKQYFPAGTRMVNPYSNFLSVIRAEGPEWLMRSCVECGYKCAEACADSSLSTQRLPNPTPDTDDTAW